jgi:hypothetical protein
VGSEYYKVATSIKDSFDYISGGAAVTGKVQGDFTIELSKNGVGNQSTTGITITEEDATHNAGKYDVDISGSTGFSAGTGTFDLVIYLTATPGDRWTYTYRVTSDGTGAGTWGDASFIPTASDGRIVVSGVPLADATVRITNASGVVLYQHTSDASGLYNRTYFSTSGTYTIQVQKSGYTVATASIVVSGSTATGPLADISLTALAVSSGMVVSTLMGYTRRVMMDYDGSKADVIILEVINDAAEYLSMTKQWPYYQTRGVIDLLADYSTGTVTITNGSPIVTLASGTWPTWAAVGELFVDDTWVTVSTRDSATQLTLTNNWGNDSVAAESYTIAKIRYALPDDCARTNDLMLGKNWPYPPEPVSAAWIEQVKDSYQDGEANPRYWAIEKNYIVTWPFATENRRVNFLYFRKPAVVTASDTLDFDSNQTVLLRRCIDYHAAMRGPCTAGTLKECKDSLDEALGLAYSWDKTTADMGLSLGMPGMRDDWLRGTITP